MVSAAKPLVTLNPFQSTPKTKFKLESAVIEALDSEMAELEDAAVRDWMTCQVRLADVTFRVEALMTEIVDPAAPGPRLNVLDGLVK